VEGDQAERQCQSGPGELTESGYVQSRSGAIRDPQAGDLAQGRRRRARFLLHFVLAGYAVAHATGGLTNAGFSLGGAPAFAVFALVVLYFILFRRYLGGTRFQRLLGAR
jgi:hypothetical protein